MPTLRDHSRVASGDHNDADIHVEYGKGIEGDDEAFERRKLEARELARGVEINPSQVRIKNRGI
jgi:hypothetical protein